MENLYTILGLRFDPERPVSEREVARAYRREALRHHPDRNPEDVMAARERFERVFVAYETLRNAVQRKEYDTQWLQWCRMRGWRDASVAGGALSQREVGAAAPLKRQRRRQEIREALRAELDARERREWERQRRRRADFCRRLEAEIARLRPTGQKLKAPDEVQSAADAPDVRRCSATRAVAEHGAPTPTRTP
ncbi:hypothetical protein CDCA_CDCA11G3324 [Cyanidium caldarium]|uniref:J domain-containing protein n=1 Tax=Cyanidium caldarium TaxID=2771 RepID=A0AAV9IYG2_CYACA|nr:hypothetical protein CDCA_CDCA11G3324 [Cyanidium caldarium]